MFLVAGDAPGGEDIQDRDMALPQIRIGEAWTTREAFDRRQSEMRHFLADERRGQARIIAGEEPQQKQRRERGEKDERQQD